MIGTEILILSIILTSLSLIERLIRNRKKFIPLLNKIRHKKQKIEESIKANSIKSDSIKDTETEEVFDELEDMIELFDDLIFSIP